ncbi:MAG: FemAB family protein [Flavobacterium sp.]
MTYNEKNYEVRLYQESDFEQWNSFVHKCNNATFLFARDFMEYHSDRFDDFSLLVFDKTKLVALMPANRVGNALYSHQGLTYGGLVYATKMKIETVREIFGILLDFFKINGIQHFFLNPIPSIYLQKGNAALDFFLLKKGGQLLRKEMNMVVNLNQEITISKSKLKHFRKSELLRMFVQEEMTCAPFWEQVLVPRLLEKYAVKPVHSLMEIEQLKQKFPNNIKQFSVYLEDKILAGITIFEFENGVKSQYGATTKLGEKYRALDFLFISLIDSYQKKGKLFFDMGIVNEASEKGFHSGLLQQKEELGCTVYSQDFYKISF